MDYRKTINEQIELLKVEQEKTKSLDHKMELSETITSLCLTAIRMPM